MSAQPEMVDDAIVVRVSYDRALWRRAMSGWWQSVVPPSSFVRRALYWAGIWFVIGAFTLAVATAGLSPLVVLWVLSGAGLMVGVFGFLQRTRMEQFWDEIGRHWDRAGDTDMTFSSRGIELVDRVSTRSMGWDAVDAVKPVKGGTVIRSGISMIVIADETLPEGLSPEGFHDALAWWRLS